MDRSLYVNTLTGKHIPLVRLLLAIKTKVTSASFLFYFLAIFKLYGLLILTIGFIPTEEAIYSYRVTRVLRSVTTLGIIGTSITYSSYTLASYLLFIIFILSLGLFVYTYKETKATEDFIVSMKARILSLILAIIFQVLLVFSQHLLEFLSFIFMIQFNSGVENSQSPFFYLIKDYQFLMNKSLSFDAYILMLINIFGIVFLNVFMYFAFKLVNEPFFDSDFPVRMRYADISMIIYVIFQNLVCIHYGELFFINIDTLKLYKFIILGVVNFLLVVSFYKTYKSFNFSNTLSYVIYFILSFAFFSSLIEILLYVASNEILSMQRLIFITISKILISYSFVNISSYINEKNFIKTLKISLFQPYDMTIEKNDLESIFYLISLLRKLDNNQNEQEALNKLMSVIHSHKSECVVENCKCTAITDYKTELLLIEINLILESIFANLNLGKEKFINILFAEYLYYQRKSTLYGWSIMNTYISKNTGLARNIEIYQLFIIIIKKVLQFDDVMKTTEYYVHFNMIFREIAASKFYEKKILSFVENFENFVKFKERFDSSIKVDPSEGIIDSYIFQTEISHLSENCEKYQRLYKNLKSFIRRDFGVVRCKSVELGYRLYSFFTIFNKKVPQYIVGMICDDSTLDKTSNTAVCKYFNESLHKFFTDTKAPMNMIIEINKMFKIKYVSNKICAALGHSYSKLINDDIHQLFPTQLREPHKNVLLNKFLIERGTFFRKKTFGFTSSNNMVALDLMVSCFPNLKKNLQAVVSVYPVLSDDKRACFFVITEFFELLSISENFDEIYSINYEVIDKLGISMVKLFDIESVINTKFKPHLDGIKRERYLKQFDHLYNLSWFLFNIKGDDARPAPFQQSHPNKSKDQNNPNGKKGGGAAGLLGGLGAVGGKGNNKDNRDSKNIKGGSEDKSGNKQDLSESTITPSGVQNNLIEKLQSGTPGENSSTPYANYNKDDLEKKNDDKASPRTNNGESYKHVEGTGKLESDHAVIRDKRTIIANLEIIRNRIKDFETGYQYYTRLCDSVIKLKKSCGISEDEIAEIPKSNLIRNRFKNNLIPPKEKNQSSVSESFHINISFRKINDSPFFLIGVKEKTVYKKENITSSKKHKLNKDLTVIGETSEDINRSDTQQTSNSNLTEKTGLKNKLKSKLKETNTEKNHTGKGDSSKKNIKGSLKDEAAKLEAERKKKEEERLNDTSALLDVSKKSKKKTSAMVSLTLEKINKQEARQKSERNKEIITTVILGILLALNLIVAILVFYFKLYVIQATQDIFSVNFWRMRHETIFTAFHSDCITYAFTLAGITSFETIYLKSINVQVPISSIPLIIDENANLVRETFANFFLAVKSSRYKLDKLENLLYSQADNYQSIILTWDAVPYNLTYINLVDYVVTKAKVLTVEAKLDEYILDINNALLFKQYNNLKNIGSASRHSALLFFLNENIQKLEKTFISFEESLKESETEFKNTVRQVTSIIEIMNIVLAFILIIVIHYTLNKFDRNLFKVLLTMFLNMSKGKKANFRGTFECEIAKIRINNIKNLLYTLNVENIRQLDESLHMDEYSVNKLLMKNFMRKDDQIGLLLENPSPKSSAPLKENSINSNLQGSISGLNSSQTPLVASDSMKELGLNEMNKDENNNLNDGSQKIPQDDNEDSKKINTKTDKKIVEKTTSSKKKKDNKDEELESQAIITNGQIIKKTKHYSIKFVLVAKIIITIVFFIYIIFIISNVVSNTINFNVIDEDTQLVSSYIMVYPQINRIFNMVRLSILTNDLSYTKNYMFYLDKYYLAEADSTILYDQFTTKLPQSHDYYKVLNELDYAKRSQYICQDTVVQRFCEAVLKKENGYNKEGLKIATNTVISKIVDIYKDYLKVRDSGQAAQLATLTSKSILLKYFNTEDFRNINCQMSLVFQFTTESYFKAIHYDMTAILENVINMNVLLGISSIFLNASIILYIILIFFRKLGKSKSYITYSATKFNRAIFQD